MKLKIVAAIALSLGASLAMAHGNHDEVDGAAPVKPQSVRKAEPGQAPAKPAPLEKKKKEAESTSGAEKADGEASSAPKSK